MNLQIISPCFYPSDEQAKLMVNSASRCGLAVTLYGVGKPFAAHGADAQVLKLYEWLQQLDDGLILVTDCKDVLFLQSTAEIVQKYMKFNSPLVMSAERELWPPNQELWDWTPKTSGGYSYVNAGQYIGQCDYIRRCLKHLLDNYRGVFPGMDNSQPWWPVAKMRGELDFALDSECQIFQTMSGSAVVEVRNGRVYNPTTSSYPASIHFNGCCGNSQPYIDMYRRIYGD